MQNTRRVDEKKFPLSIEQEVSADALNVQKLDFVDQTQKIAASNQKVQIPKSVGQTQVRNFASQETAAPNQKVQNFEFVDQKPTPPQNQDLRPKPQDPASENMPISKSVDQKTLARFESLRTQILERKELIAQGGSLIETWRNHQGKRLGPYYQVAFRENRVLHTLYIGRDEQLATMVSALIDELKTPLREDRILRQLRAAAKAGLRRALAEADALAVPLGYRRRGYSFHKQR